MSSKPPDNRTCAYVYPPRGTQGYGADVCGRSESHLAHTQGHPFTPVSEEPKCPDGLLPDGPVCPRCGVRRAPSGADGGSWVHFPPEAEGQSAEYRNGKLYKRNGVLTESPKDAVKDEYMLPEDAFKARRPVKDEGFDAAWVREVGQLPTTAQERHEYDVAREWWNHGLNARRSIPPMDVRAGARKIVERIWTAFRDELTFAQMGEVIDAIADELSQLTRGDA